MSMGWRDLVISGIYSTILVFQIVFTFFNYNKMGLDNVANVGWTIMMVSGIFGWVPILTFRKMGGVPEGRSYTNTTVLVDTGIYSIVRHPQFLAGILISLSLVLISQHWLNLVLFVPVVVGTYIDSLNADERLIKKFGHEYESYIKKVPGLNFISGIIRLLRRAKRDDKVIISYLFISLTYN